MKKRSKLRSVMFIPPMLVLSIMWSTNSNAMNPLIMPQLIDANVFRTLAVVEDDKEEYVTRPEEIEKEAEDLIDQKSIDEAALEVVVQTEGALPKEVSSAEVGVEISEEGQVDEIDETETEEKQDEVACVQKVETEDISEEMEKLRVAMISEFTEFFKTAFLPMYLNYFTAKSFKAPEVYQGLAGIPAQNQNFGAGLGLNLLSLSDYFNTRSIGMTTPFTQNVYNITNEYQTGFNSGSANPMSVPFSNTNFNDSMSPQMMNHATASSYSYNFNSLSVQNHSRFDQMNAQNKVVPISNPGIAPASVMNPGAVNTQPRANTTLPTMMHTIHE